jgi:hypothetical protein
VSGRTTRRRTFVTWLQNWTPLRHWPPVVADLRPGTGAPCVTRLIPDHFGCTVTAPQLRGVKAEPSPFYIGKISKDPSCLGGDR